MEEDDDIPLLPMRLGSKVVALIDIVHTSYLMVVILVIEMVRSPYSGYD